MKILKKALEGVLRWSIKNPVTSKLIESSEWLHKKINCLVINSIVHRARTRPHPWSTQHSYTSWDALTDKTWSARHLPERECLADCDDTTGCLRDWKVEASGCSRGWKKASELAELFRIKSEQQRSTLSSCLFPAFAQHLTDGFIQTRMPKVGKGPAVRLRNRSNHDIDLSPLYGRTKAQTDILRMRSEKPGERGKLRYQILDGEMYAPFLFDRDGNHTEPGFDELDPPLGFHRVANDPARRGSLFAFGGDRANAAPQVAMINTLFLREHNRLAEELEKEHPEWDDERVFQTARNAVIVLYIKIVVEEYINHISSARMNFIADPPVAWRAKWNRPNWITTEFSLLYRWHSLVPHKVQWPRHEYETAETILNNQPLFEGSLLENFKKLSAQSSAQLGVFNTAPSLVPLEENAIAQGRLAKLQTYNAYREYVGLPPAKTFSDISSDPSVAKFLSEHYGHVDDVEFYIGLFAEDLVENSPLPQLMTSMVAIDAFSQALTNPLLSRSVFEQGEKVFGEAGWDAIQDTSSLADVLARHYKGFPLESVSMVRSSS